MEKDDYPSISFADSSPDKGSLGALPRQRKALGAEEGRTVAGVLQSAANLKIT